MTEEFIRKHTILTSKLRCPQLNHLQIERPALLRLLKDGINKTVTLVQAPAGYGKTTAVAQWFSQHNGPKAWLSIDELDNDFPKFVSYFYAITKHKRDKKLIPWVFKNWSKITPANVDVIIHFFIQYLSQFNERPVLVLDDIHWITDPEIIYTIERFLKFANNRIHLIFITRTSVQVRLNDLMLNDQVQFINTRDLTFTQAEAKLFLTKQLKLNKRELQIAIQEFSGWAAGLQIFRLARENHLPLSQQQTLLSDYVGNEIIRLLPEQTLAIALKVAVSRRFNLKLLQSLAPNVNAMAFISELEDRHSIITTTQNEDGDPWYQFHSLFRQALLDYFQKNNALEYVATQRACAQWWLQHACYSEAAEHLTRSGDLELIQRILINHGWSFYRTGQYKLLKECFDALSTQTIAGNSTLTLTYAWWSLIHERPKQADDCIRLSEKLILLSDSDKASYWSVKAAIAVVFDDFTAAENWAKQALYHKELPRPWEHCHAFLAIAETHINQCNFDEAEAKLESANQICQREGYTTLLIQVLYLQAEIQCCKGRWQQAEIKLDIALKLGREKGVSKLFSLDQLEWTLARVLRLQGKIQRAEKTLNRIDFSHRPLGDYWQYPVLSEQLFTGLLNHHASNPQWTGMSKQIQYLATNYQYCMKWQLFADQALILYWIASKDKAALSYIASRYEPIKLQTLRFSLHAQFNRALALFGCGRVNLSIKELIKCLKRASSAGYVELQLLCQLFLVIAYRHRGDTLAANGLQHQISQNSQPIELLNSVEHLFSGLQKKQRNSDITAETNQEVDLHTPLTKAEQKVAALLAKNMTNKEVAKQLDVSPSTIRSHIKSINKKQKVVSISRRA